MNYKVWSHYVQPTPLILRVRHASASQGVDRSTRFICKNALTNLFHNFAYAFQRQETLKRLIHSAHSQYAPLKILAAGNMRFFLKDFPDLEEAAIDAIYDLCEDSAAQVYPFPAATHSFF